MVSVSAETENVISAAVSVMAVTGKSGFGRSLTRPKADTDFTVPWRVDGFVNLGRAVVM